MLARFLRELLGLFLLADADVIEGFGQCRRRYLGLDRIASSQNALFDIGQILLRFFVVGRQRKDSLICRACRLACARAGGGSGRLGRLGRRP